MVEENTHPIEETPEPGSFRLIFTLSFAGFLSGLVLVVAFLYTKPKIEQNKAEALRIAIYKVLPGTDSIITFELSENRLAEVSEQNGKSGEGSNEKIYLGLSKTNEVIGFAIPGAEFGFQDIIGVIFGFKADEKMIIGFEVLESKETPGLGDKIYKDADFTENFVSLSVEPEISIVKKGSKRNPNEVEAITGATISSKAVVRLLNKSIRKWKKPVEDYMKDNKMNLTKHADE